MTMVGSAMLRSTWAALRNAWKTSLWSQVSVSLVNEKFVVSSMVGWGLRCVVELLVQITVWA